MEGDNEALRPLICAEKSATSPRALRPLLWAGLGLGWLGDGGERHKSGPQSIDAHPPLTFL